MKLASDESSYQTIKDSKVCMTLPLPQRFNFVALAATYLVRRVCFSDESKGIFYVYAIFQIQEMLLLNEPRFQDQLSP